VASYCETVKDYPLRYLFIALMADKEGHIDFLETQVDMIERIGLQFFIGSQIGEVGACH